MVSNLLSLRFEVTAYCGDYGGRGEVLAVRRAPQPWLGRFLGRAAGPAEENYLFDGRRWAAWPGTRPCGPVLSRVLDVLRKDARIIERLNNLV